RRFASRPSSALRAPSPAQERGRRGNFTQQLRRLDRWNPGDLPAQLAFSMPKIIGCLHAQPKHWAIPAQLAKSERHFSRNRRLFGEDAVEKLPRDAEGPSGAGNTQTKGRQHIVARDRSRMSRATLRITL